MKLGGLYRGSHCIIPRVWLAATPWARLRGLLGRPPLQDRAREGLLLRPCASIHTFGMTYPIDVVFLDRMGGVLRLCEAVPARRARRARGAFQTLELAAGSLAHLQLGLGEMLLWQA